MLQNKIYYNNNVNYAKTPVTVDSAKRLVKIEKVMFIILLCSSI